jgi:predicted component of type VI protein secretion system
MKSTRNGLGLALLALSLSFGGSLVRAEEPASPFENIVSDPLAKVVQTIELRLAGVEATMMAFAGSFSSDHITTQRLCVSDGSGETCITRAQLDALLKLQVQLGQAPATAEQPAVIVGEASAPPVTTATAPAAEVVETVATIATVTMESPKPATEPAEAVTAEAVIVESPKPEAEIAPSEPATVTAAAQTRKDDEPANLDSVASFSPVPESKSANEEAPAPERVE